MYIDTVPNRKSPPAVLLRKVTRQGKKVVKETVANLSECEPEVIAGLRLLLKGKKLVPVDELLTVERSLPHGHVQAVLGVMRQLGIDTLLSSRPCRQRNLIMAIIAQHILAPSSKLATTRMWHTTTLAQELSVDDAHVNELYDALNWLVERQKRIEKKLAKRHLAHGATVLFDISSSSYHGLSCPLAVRGYNRDGEKLPSIVYGVLADAQGRPISVEVYPGNTADPVTVPDQVEKLRGQFGLEHVVLVGDRGMLTQTQIETLRQYPQLGWISALRFGAIRKLVEQKAFEPSLRDKVNLAEIIAEDYPEERLVVCYNPDLEQKRKRTREELLAATEADLQKIADQCSRRTKKPIDNQEIAVKVGKVLDKHKVGKHFEYQIANNTLDYKRKQEHIKVESRLDGFYIIRTSESNDDWDTPDVVRTYKSLAMVEQAFRCIKKTDIHVRPVRHRNEQRVRAHIFVCMLAYYVVWHLRKTLAPILFEDENLDEDRWIRDPVKKAIPSPSAKAKKLTRQSTQGWPVHSLQTLWAEMGTRCKNNIKMGEGKTEIKFTLLTEPSDFLKHVFELLGIKMG